MASIIQIPAQALIDEAISIKLTGFSANQSVTLRADVRDDWGRAWYSHATFQTGDQGNVDLATAAPLDGTYDSADATGLFWSLRLASGEPVNLPVLKNGTTDPAVFTFTAQVDGETVATATFIQRYVAEGVTRHEVRDDGLAGIYFQPAGEGPFPAVLVFTGSGGGLGALDVNKAALLASRGYAALYLAYFNYEGVPAQLVNIPLEYFETGLNWLQNRPEIDGGKLAVQGLSRGGELALLLGAIFPQVKAVLAYVPSGIVWPGFSGDPTIAGPAWTYKGQPVTPADDSHVPPEYLADMVAAIGTEKVFANTPLIRAAYETATNLADAIIPVERIQGGVLLISGKDDQMWPSSLLAEVAYERLKQQNHPYSYEHVAYDDVGHLILLPLSPTSYDYILHPVVPLRLALGGTPRQNAFANVDSWTRVLAFLRENLG